MRNMLNLPSLALHIKSVAMNAAYRLGCVGMWKTDSRRHKQLFGVTLREFWKEPQDRIPPRPLRNARYKIRFPERKRWEECSSKHGEIWFTDGFKAKEGVGAGFCGPRQQDSFCFRMANYNTVFQAEVLAIKLCAEELTRAGKTGKTIWICSDSQVALRAIKKTVTCSKLVMETKASLNALGMINLLNLTWIPGHCRRKKAVTG